MESIINMLNISIAIKYFLFMMIELTLLFLLIGAVISYILMHMPYNKIHNWMANKGFGGYIIGALAGAIAPLWSYTTIPLTLAFIESGVPIGAVITFTVAAPLINPIIMAKIASLMGGSIAQWYFVIIIVLSIVSGVIVEKKGGEKFIKTYYVGFEAKLTTTEIPKTIIEKVKKSCYKSWEDYKHVFLFLLIGSAIGATINTFMPEYIISKISDRNNLAAIPVAAVAGAPYFLRAEVAIPIGSSLINKGMSAGVVIAMIISGAGIDIPAVSLLVGIFKKKLVVAYCFIIIFIAICVGFIIEII